MAQQGISMQNPPDNGGNSRVGDFTEDNNIANPSDVLAFSCLWERIGTVLDTVTRLEGQVSMLRLGLKDECNRTLEEVEPIFRIIDERIRLIEAKVPMTTRYPTGIHSPHGFLPIHCNRRRQGVKILLLMTGARKPFNGLLISGPLIVLQVLAYHLRPKVRE
jgi:hypothetical protein